MKKVVKIKVKVTKPSMSAKTSKGTSVKINGSESTKGLVISYINNKYFPNSSSKDLKGNSCFPNYIN